MSLVSRVARTGVSSRSSSSSSSRRTDTRAAEELTPGQHPQAAGPVIDAEAATLLSVSSPWPDTEAETETVTSKAGSGSTSGSLEPLPGALPGALAVAWPEPLTEPRPEPPVRAMMTATNLQTLEPVASQPATCQQGMPASSNTLQYEVK